MQATNYEFQAVIDSTAGLTDEETTRAIAEVLQSKGLQLNPQIVINVTRIRHDAEKIVKAEQGFENKEISRDEV